MKTGIAHLPLHSGKAPYWLFHRMKNLAREITTAIIYEFGPLEMLKKLYKAICCDRRDTSLNMVATKSEDAREASAIASKEKPDRILCEVKKLQTLNLPRHHQVLIEDINPKRFNQILLTTHERQPKDFESLLGIRGVGPKTIRSLSLVAELVYGKKPSFLDPARFSFAHGGKGGHPYPVDCDNYDRSIRLLKNCISSAKIDRSEKIKAIKRLDHSIVGYLKQGSKNLKPPHSIIINSVER